MEIDTIVQENAVIKQRNDKLRAIEREFSNQALKKPPAKAQTNKYAHVRGKLGDQSMKKSEQDFLKLTEALKV